MIQSVKRYLAIRSYVRRLSNDLSRRFGKRAWYTVDQVSQAVKRGKYSDEYIIYAHAAYCRLEDFESFYRASGQADRWVKLRQIISRRYLSGQFDFDAGTIYTRYRNAVYTRGISDEDCLGVGSMGDDGGGSHH